MEGQSFSLDIQNSYAIEMVKMSEAILERLKIGMNIGIWETLTTYSSDNELVSKLIGEGCIQKFLQIFLLV